MSTDTINKVGSFDTNYGDDALRTFTKEERSRLEVLHQRLDNKFDEIASFLAKTLGFGKADDPRVIDEATQAVERWEEDASMADNPISPVGPLQTLLSEQHSISEDIQDVWDDAMQRDEVAPLWRR